MTYIIAAVALLCASAIVLSSGMGFKWFFLVFVALLAFATAMVFPDFRLFMLLLLSACIPVAIEYNLLEHGSKYVITEHFGGAQNALMIHLIDFPIAGLFFVWIADLASGQKTLPSWERIDTYILLMIFSSTISLYQTSEYGLLFFEIFRYFKYFLLLWILRTYLTDQNYVKYCLYVVLLLAGFEFLVGCLQYFFFFTLPFPVGGVSGSQFDMIANTVIQRVSGTVGHANTFAAYLLFPIVLSFIFMLSRYPLIIRILAAGFFLASSIALVLTFSRNAWMNTAIAVFIITIVGMRTRRISSNYIFVILGLGMAAVAALVATGVAEIIFVRIFEDDGKAYDSRWDLIGVALEMISDQPLFGIGLNSFEEQMSGYDETGVTNIIQQPVHNFLFLVAAETGMITFIIFMLICIAIGKHIMRLIRAGVEDSFTVGVSTGIIFLVLMISNQFDVTLRKVPIIGMCVLFLAMVMATNNRLAAKKSDHEA